MEQLHKHEFISLLIDALSSVLQAHFHSYVSSAIGAWFLIHLSNPSFCLSFTHFLMALLIHFGIPHFIASHLSRYHWWLRYPFAMLPMWEWAHCNSWYILRYRCINCIREWSSCTKKGLSPFTCHTWRQVDIIRDNFRP